MPETLVPTGSGPVRGRSTGGVRSWRGIPYGRADRFAAAEPHPGWTGPHDATTAGPVPVQVDAGGRLVGTEDCLTLDVYAPEDAEGPLPVLFWIYGGAFRTGAAAEYDGSVLAAAGPCVVVAVNYRVGVLGFLQLGTPAAPTPSWALTDLRLALSWVHREIAAFGGDPGEITLGGQSAGAMLTCALAATGTGRLARRAFGFSTGDPVLEPAEATATTGAVRDALRVARDDPAALTTMPVERLVAAAAEVERAAVGRRPAGVVFRPVVDGAVLPSAPVEAVRAGALRNTPLWLGWCRDEMSSFLPGEPAEVQARATDEMWVRPTLQLARAQADAGGTVWLSRFDATPSLPPFPALGPAHGADNACLWAHPPRFIERPLLGRPGGPMNAADLAVTAQLHAAVLSFVTTGTPAAPALPGWPAAGRESRPVAVFDTRCRIEQCRIECGTTSEA